MKNKEKLFTSEQVSNGHPDKICDQISDAIVTYCLNNDEESRVAIECLIKDDMVVVAGEVTTKANLEKQIISNLVGNVFRKIGLDGSNHSIILNITKQSPDIAQGVDVGGAGDQGIMFGYATSETDCMLPLPYVIATDILKELEKYRQTDENIKSDAKSQVTFDYNNNRIHTILVSTQHSDKVDLEYVRACIKDIVIKVVHSYGLNQDYELLVNPTGRFVIGGSYGDTGVTGRKIIADTYGGMARHGGGAFSGKDPSKVDRSAAYMARHIAKDIVFRKYAHRCEIQLSYAIGVAEPISVLVDTFGTHIDINIEANAKLEGLTYDEYLSKWVTDWWKGLLTPQGMTEYLLLKEIDYNKVSSYGHFTNQEMPWEKDPATLITGEDDDE